jgi:hypothetical protein
MRIQSIATARHVVVRADDYPTAIECARRSRKLLHTLGPDPRMTARRWDARLDLVATPDAVAAAATTCGARMRTAAARLENALEASRALHRRYEESQVAVHAAMADLEACAMGARADPTASALLAQVATMRSFAAASPLTSVFPAAKP